MKRSLLPPDTQYKTNLHCHSTRSDGSLSPARLKELYRAHGYSAVAFTDHNGLFYHDELTDAEFIALAGFEIDFGEDRPDALDWTQNKTCHLCAIVRDPITASQNGFGPAPSDRPSVLWSQDEKNRKLIFRDDTVLFAKDYAPESVSEAIKVLNERGFLVHYNHPRWSLEEYPDYIGYKGLHGVELYNHGCFLEGYDEYNGDVYDALLRSGQRLIALATDDNHRDISHPQHDMFGGFTMIAAKELSYRGLIGALEKGDCYASTGPLIRELSCEMLAEDHGRVYLAVEGAVDYIRMTADIRAASLRYNANGEKITEATFDFDPHYVKYIRFEVGDGIRRAYTRAYFTPSLS